MEHQCPVLVLDDEEGSLGPLSLALVRAGIDVLYANDLDEITLLSKERGHPGVLVLAPNAVALEIHGRLEKRLRTNPSGVIPVGHRPTEREVEAFRSVGFKWNLWDCEDPEAARYVVAAAIWDLDESEIRFDGRAPVQVDGTLSHKGAEEPIVVTDVAVGGACALCGPPPQVKTVVDICFQLPKGEVKQQARVAWAKPLAASRSRVGFSFPQCDEQTERILRNYVSQWMAPYRLAR
jgi:hypothetical protein